MERFIRNGNFFDKEIDNGKFVIKIFLIKHKFKIRKLIIKMFLIKHKFKIRKLFDFKCILINI